VACVLLTDIVLWRPVSIPLQVAFSCIWTRRRAVSSLAISFARSRRFFPPSHFLPLPPPSLLGTSLVHLLPPSVARFPLKCNIMPTDYIFLFGGVCTCVTSSLSRSYSHVCLCLHLCVWCSQSMQWGFKYRRNLSTSSGPSLTRIERAG